MGLCLRVVVPTNVLSTPHPPEVWHDRLCASNLFSITCISSVKLIILTSVKLQHFIIEINVVVRRIKNSKYLTKLKAGLCLSISRIQIKWLFFALNHADNPCLSK